MLKMLGGMLMIIISTAFMLLLVGMVAFAFGLGLKLAGF